MCTFSKSGKPFGALLPNIEYSGLMGCERRETCWYLVYVVCLLRPPSMLSEYTNVVQNESNVVVIIERSVFSGHL